jgi:electron transport complex protein RnfD
MREQSPAAFFLKPQTNLSVRTGLQMALVSAAAFFVAAQSALSDNFASLFVALTCVATAVISELLIGLITGRQTIRDASSVVTALVLTLFLPNRIPPQAAALGTAFAIIIIKQCSGGLGSNWLNPALGGVLFIRFSWSHIWSAALGSTRITENIFFDVNSFLSNRLTTSYDFLNDRILTFLSAVIPYEYIELFMMTGSGIIADRGFLALIIAGIILCAFIPYRTYKSFIFIAVYSLLIYSGIGTDTPPFKGDTFYAICTGGTFAGAFFLLGDPITGPKSNRGAVIYSLSAALLTYYFRFIKHEVYAVCFSIALLNTIIPFLREIERKYIYERSVLQMTTSRRKITITTEEK